MSSDRTIARIESTLEEITDWLQEVAEKADGANKVALDFGTTVVSNREQQIATDSNVQTFADDDATPFAKNPLSKDLNCDNATLGRFNITGCENLKAQKVFAYGKRADTGTDKEVDLLGEIRTINTLLDTQTATALKTHVDASGEPLLALLSDNIERVDQIDQAHLADHPVRLDINVKNAIIGGTATFNNGVTVGGTATFNNGVTVGTSNTPSTASFTANGGAFFSIANANNADARALSITQGKMFAPSHTDNSLVDVMKTISEAGAAYPTTTIVADGGPRDPTNTGRSIVNDVLNNDKFSNFEYVKSGKVIRGNEYERAGAPASSDGDNHSRFPKYNSKPLAINASGTVKVVGVPFAHDRFQNSNGGDVVVPSSYGNTSSDPEVNSRPHSNAAQSFGAVRVYEYNRISNSWDLKGSQLGPKVTSSSDKPKIPRFGFSVDINNDGDIIVIGQPNGDMSTGTQGTTQDDHFKLANQGISGGYRAGGAVSVYYYGVDPSSQSAYTTDTPDWHLVKAHQPNPNATNDGPGASSGTDLDRLRNHRPLAGDSFGYSVAINGDAKTKKHTYVNQDGQEQQRAIGLEGRNSKWEEKPGVTGVSSAHLAPIGQPCRIVVGAPEHGAEYSGNENDSSTPADTTTGLGKAAISMQEDVLGTASDALGGSDKFYHASSSDFRNAGLRAREGFVNIYEYFDNSGYLASPSTDGSDDTADTPAPYGLLIAGAHRYPEGGTDYGESGARDNGGFVLMYYYPTELDDNHTTSIANDPYYLGPRFFGENGRADAGIFAVGSSNPKTLVLGNNAAANPGGASGGTSGTGSYGDVANFWWAGSGGTDVDESLSTGFCTRKTFSPGRQHVKFAPSGTGGSLPDRSTSAENTTYAWYTERQATGWSVAISDDGKTVAIGAPTYSIPWNIATDEVPTNAVNTGQYAHYSTPATHNLRGENFGIDSPNNFGNTVKPHHGAVYILRERLSNRRFNRTTHDGTLLGYVQPGTILTGAVGEYGAGHQPSNNSKKMFQTPHDLAFWELDISSNSTQYRATPTTAPTDVNGQNITKYGGDLGHIVDEYVSPLGSGTGKTKRTASSTLVYWGEANATDAAARSKRDDVYEQSHIPPYTGACIALSGDGKTLVVGSPGARLGEGWNGVGAFQSNTTAHPLQGGQGYVRVYNKDDTNGIWKRTTKALGPNTTVTRDEGKPLGHFIGNVTTTSHIGDVPSRFGLSLDVNYDGTLVCVGAPDDSSDNISKNTTTQTDARHGSLSMFWYGQKTTFASSEWHLMKYLTGVNVIAQRNQDTALHTSMADPIESSNGFQTGAACCINKEGSITTFTSAGGRKQEAEMAGTQGAAGSDNVQEGHIDTFRFKYELTNEAKYDLFRVIKAFEASSTST